jgi:hypothetical protein
MSESKSNIFVKPTDDEINTLLFNDDQIPISINSDADADVNAQEKSIDLVNSNEVKPIDQDKKLGQAIKASDQKNTDSIENQEKTITSQKSPDVTINASDPKNTDPTQKTYNDDDDDTGVNLQLRLPKKMSPIRNKT